MRSRKADIQDCLIGAADPHTCASVLSPMTKQMESRMLDFPVPLSPVMALKQGSKLGSVTREAYDLKPSMVISSMYIPKVQCLIAVLWVPGPLAQSGFIYLCLQILKNRRCVCVNRALLARAGGRQVQTLDQSAEYKRWLSIVNSKWIQISLSYSNSDCACSTPRPSCICSQQNLAWFDTHYVDMFKTLPRASARCVPCPSRQCLLGSSARIPNTIAQRHCRAGPDSAVTAMTLLDKAQIFSAYTQSGDASQFSAVVDKDVVWR